MIIQIEKDRITEIADDNSGGNAKTTLRFGNTPGLQEITSDDSGNMSMPLRGNLTFYNAQGFCLTFRADGSVVMGRVSEGDLTQAFIPNALDASAFPTADPGDGKTVWLNNGVLTLSSVTE